MDPLFSLARGTIRPYHVDMEKNLTDRQVLKELGAAAITARFQITEYAFRKWIQRGIPWDRRGHVAELAKARGVTIPGDFFKERRAA